MPEQGMIEEVRAAKVWVDAQAATLGELGDRLVVIERAYQLRTGEFTSLPITRSESVQRQIDAAADEPGRDFLSDLKSAS